MSIRRTRTRLAVIGAAVLAVAAAAAVYAVTRDEPGRPVYLAFVPAVPEPVPSGEEPETGAPGQLLDRTPVTLVDLDLIEVRHTHLYRYRVCEGAQDCRTVGRYAVADVTVYDLLVYGDQIRPTATCFEPGPCGPQPLLAPADGDEPGAADCEAAADAAVDPGEPGTLPAAEDRLAFGAWPGTDWCLRTSTERWRHLHGDGLEPGTETPGAQDLVLRWTAIA